MGMLEKSPRETGGPLTTSILKARVKTEEASKWRSDMIPIYILEMPVRAAGLRTGWSAVSETAGRGSQCSQQGMEVTGTPGDGDGAGELAAGHGSYKGVAPAPG